MGSRFLFALVLTGTFTSLGASYRTPNFVVEAPTDDAAERVAQSAERLRKAEAKRWLGKELADWPEICPVEVVLSKRVGGRADLKFVGGRVEQTLRVEGTLPLILSNVLPHEMTHIIIANHFHCQVPRWADEGMAVLSEPRERIELHLRNLPTHRRDGTLFHLDQLMRMGKYPEPRFIGPFYAQGVSLVEFLSQRNGPQVFARFLREGLQGGYEPALRKYYNFRDFAELEREWQRHAFGGEAAASAGERR